MIRGAEPAPGGGETSRVLLVEARADDYHRTRAMLDGAGHTRFSVDWAQSLADATARLRAGAYEAILIDPELPDGDGLSLARLAQDRGQGAPLIVLARRGTLELDLQAMALGVTDFLEKDRVDATLLERAIRYALARRRQADRLNHLAQHDDLTGLANRALFQDRLGRALAWARRHGRRVAVMVLDLNGFKAVNDGLGHAAGDELLRIVGARLRDRLRETDTVARLGGDEFALVIENLSRAEHAALVARKILDAVAPAIALNHHEVMVTASVGVALYPTDGEEPALLLRTADAAMYRAKSEGGNLCRFASQELERRVQRGALLESDLRRGLARREFVLHFQPQVSLEAPEVGVSALVRWHHPELGLIGAERFLPLAEATGLLEDLTDWVFEAGCRQLRLWRERGLDRLHLALPLLSRQQLGWADLAGRVRKGLLESDVAPDRLEVEVSEELLLADAERGSPGVNGLKQLGVRVALDGFGRGPTSLRGLQLGLLSTLKLAPELLDGVPEHAARTALVAVLLDLGRNLGLRLVAEGVDRQEQLSFLRRRGCSAVQAFMSCPPLPADACAGWLRQAALRRERRAEPPRAVPLAPAPEPLSAPPEPIAVPSRRLAYGAGS